MAELNYEKDLRIDEDSLDLELLNQASLFMKYAKHYAFTQKVVEETRQALDIKRAEVDKAIRENPEKFKIEKVTEGAIQSTILTDKGYQEVNQKHLEAQYEKNMASNATQAVTMRKEMLEGMIKLLAQSYFAGPSVPHDLSKARKEREKTTESSIGTRLTRRSV
jgi:hypothetical protein